MTQQSQIYFWLISSELNKALTLNLKMSIIIVKMQAIGN